jgi:hypothetical protein
MNLYVCTGKYVESEIESVFHGKVNKANSSYAENNLEYEYLGKFESLYEIVLDHASGDQVDSFCKTSYEAKRGSCIYVNAEYYLYITMHIRNKTDITDLAVLK